VQSKTGLTTDATKEHGEGVVPEPIEATWVCVGTKGRITGKVPQSTRFYVVASSESTVLFVMSLLLSHCSKQFNTLFAMHAQSSNAPKGRSARLKRG
jgi:hypothetical protein